MTKNIDEKIAIVTASKLRESFLNISAWAPNALTKLGHTYVMSKQLQVKFQHNVRAK